MFEQVLGHVEGGPWGCIVIFAAFFIQVLAFGTSQSIGVYNIELLQHFDAGAAAVSLVGSINLGVFLGAGPLASMLMARWSHRQVALLGASLSNIGLIVLPFATSLPYMYIFYGVITGFGYCLVYVPSHVLSGLYFSKQRSLATGIATSGSGFGATIFPIIIYEMIGYYTWRGSLILLAGLNLHLFIFASLLRPVPKKLARELAQYEEDEKLKNENEVPSLTAARMEVNGDKCDAEDADKENESSKLIEENIDSNGKQVKREEEIVYVGDANQEGGTVSDFECSQELRDFTLKQRLKKHFSAIISVDFILYWFSNICWNAGAGILIVFLPKFMISIGLAEEESASIFTLLGAGSCIGCVLGGVLGNIRYFNRIVLYITGNVGAGVATVLLPVSLFQSVLGQTLLVLLFGLMFGIILGLLVVVTSDLIGTEGLGDGFGYLMFANGIGIFGGPPLAGVITDRSGDWALAMYFSGILTIFGGVIMSAVPVKRMLTGSRGPIGKTREFVIETPE